MTRKRKAPKVTKEPKKFKEYVDVEPDPNSEDYFYDEIDQFNMDKEKILLGDTYKPQKQKTVVEEEIFPVAEFDSDEDDDNIQNWEKQIKQLRLHGSSKASLIAPNSFVQEKSDEPRETTWGRKKAQEYGADVIDDVDISDSEENAALLEEKEALAIQKRQLEQIDETDFNFERYKTEMKAMSESIKTVQKDVSKLTLEEKRDIVKKENPEIVPIYLDAITKCQEAQKILCPIVEAYKKGLLPKHSLFDYLQSKLSLYLIHVANTAFYRALKLRRVNTRNHPVVETIFSYIEKFKNLKEIDQQNAPAVRHVLKMLKNGNPELVTVESLDRLLKKDEDSVDTTDSTSKRVQFADEKGTEEVPYEEENDDDDDRTVDYKIERNKGITPKRKKANRNPRIKYKEKYRKALIRQRGQKPQMRSQLHPYAGELSGIRAGVNKGIKLRA